MDLLEYGRVIRRQALIVVLGLTITFALMLLALVRVSGDGLALRSSPIFGARSVLLVTQASFPWGRASAPPQADASRMEYLAGVYAELARSGELRGLIQSGEGPLPADSYDVTQLMGTGRTLPLIEVVGKSTSEAGSVAISNAVATALRRYILTNQNRSSVPARDRVDLRVVTRATKAEALQGVKLTTPILLFLLGVVVTLVSAFARDNVTRNRGGPGSASPLLEPPSRTAVELESVPEEPAIGPRAVEAHRSFSRRGRGIVD